jgi:hypothetical protein
LKKKEADIPHSDELLPGIAAVDRAINFAFLDFIPEAEYNVST